MDGLVRESDSSWPVCAGRCELIQETSVTKMIRVGHAGLPKMKIGTCEDRIAWNCLTEVIFLQDQRQATLVVFAERSSRQIAFDEPCVLIVSQFIGRGRRASGKNATCAIARRAAASESIFSIFNADKLRLRGSTERYGGQAELNQALSV
jgi:hypothetical protein